MRLVELKLWNASWFIFWRNTGGSSAALHGCHTMAVAPCRPQTLAWATQSILLTHRELWMAQTSKRSFLEQPWELLQRQYFHQGESLGSEGPIDHSTAEDLHSHFWRSSAAHTSLNWDMVSLIVVFLPHFSLYPDLDFNSKILYSNLINAHTTQPILGTARFAQAQSCRTNRVRSQTLLWCFMDLNSVFREPEFCALKILNFGAVTSFQCSILDATLASNSQKLKYSIWTHFANSFSNQSTNKSLNKFDFGWPNERLHNSPQFSY